MLPTPDTHLNLLQLEEGCTVLAEKQEDLGAPAVAAHIRSLTEPRSEEERLVGGLKLLPGIYDPVQVFSAM